MMQKTQKRTKFRTLRSLNIILWLVFSLFAVAIILALAFIYRSLAARAFFDRASRSLLSARDEIVADLTQENTSEIDTVAYRYGRSCGSYNSSYKKGLQTKASLYRSRRRPRAYPVRW